MRTCCTKVPDGVSDKAAAVIEPLAVIVRAIHQSGFKAMDTCVVIGAGPIGMLTGIVLKFAGASKVFISDVAAKRLDQARAFGLIPGERSQGRPGTSRKDATDGEGCDTLFECSGAACRALGHDDGYHKGKRQYLHRIRYIKRLMRSCFRDVNFKEQHIVGTRVYTREEFKEAVELSRLLEEQTGAGSDPCGTAKRQREGIRHDRG